MSCLAVADWSLGFVILQVCRECVVRCPMLSCVDGWPLVTLLSIVVVFCHVLSCCALFVVSVCHHSLLSFVFEMCVICVSLFACLSLVCDSMHCVSFVF